MGEWGRGEKRYTAEDGAYKEHERDFSTGGAIPRRKLWERKGWSAGIVSKQIRLNRGGRDHQKAKRNFCPPNKQRGNSKKGRKRRKEEK